MFHYDSMYTVTTVTRDTSIDMNVSLYDECPYVTGVPISQVSLYHRCPYMAGVPIWQVSLYGRCPYMTGVPIWQVSLYGRCPYMTGVPIWQVSLCHRILDRTPFWEIVPGSEVVLYWECPLETGVTVLWVRICHGVSLPSIAYTNTMSRDREEPYDLYHRLFVYIVSFREMRISYTYRYLHMLKWGERIHGSQIKLV